MRTTPRLLTAAVAATMLLPATALAADYPPASDPGKGPKNPAKGGTLRVCKKGCRYKKIQDAVDAAGKGTTIRVGKGTYKEGVRVLSSRKDRVKLIGDPRNPANVVLEGKGLKGTPAQNGVQVNNADGVTIDGFTARHFKGNGFFAVNVDGYKMDHLVADTSGVYGLYAFNSKGGRMTNSEAFYHNDAGFYVGQTPPQTKPKRTLIKNVIAWGNVLGYSGTNSRYVTITKSKFFNNGSGLVPNALDSEKFQPDEDNTIVDNDVFWNNFNYLAGAPFKVRKNSLGFRYPAGLGLLIFGGRRNVIQGNRIFGNYLSGTALLSQFLLKKPANGDVQDNVFRDNVLGQGGTDLNGRDMYYDGSGSGNCFEGNVLTSPTLPEDGSTFAPCPGPKPNAYRDDMRNLVISWIDESSWENHWVRNPHTPIEGITPLEHWTANYPHPEVK